MHLAGGVVKMMKALLIVTAASFGSYEVEMPSMAQCLKAKEQVISQSEKVETLCVPTQGLDREADKMERFFGIFMGIVNQLKQMEEQEKFEWKEGENT